jgi:hypothetical protein
MSDGPINTTADEPVGHCDEISPENQREIDAFLCLFECLRPNILKINAVCAKISEAETPRQKKRNTRAKEYAQELVNTDKEKVGWFVTRYADNFLFFDVKGVLYGTFSHDARALEYLVAYSWGEVGHDPKTRRIARLVPGLLTYLATRPVEWIPALQATRI